MRALLLVLLLTSAATVRADVSAPVGQLAWATTPDALEAAEEALLAAGPGVEAELLVAIPRLKPEAAAVALRVLAELKTPGAPAALLEAAESTDEPRRQAAADQLARFAERPEAALALVWLCKDASDEVAVAAAGGLRASAPQAAWDGLLELVAAAPESPRPQVRLAAEALRRVLAAAPSAERVERLLAAAAMGTGAARRLLLEALTEGGAPAAPALLALLEVAWKVELLEPADRTRALDHLGPLADAVPVEARELAVRGLGRVAAVDPRAARAAVRALTDPSPRVRAAGLRALAVPASGAERIELLALLVELLVDPDDGLRREAHARLVRETGQRLPLSQPAWSGWLARPAPPSTEAP